MDLEELSYRVTRSASIECPGGVGNFGFNSYDLLTFGLLVLGAVSLFFVVNTNKNENNNNNNDFQASLGMINTNAQTASADQTSTNMVMIIVPPNGVPIVIPGGRMLSNGMVNLTRGAEKQGVSWKSDQFQAFDNGTFIEEIHAGNQTEFQRSRGLVAFGTVDERNVFHMMTTWNGQPVTWKLLRQLNINNKVKARDPKTEPEVTDNVIDFDAKPVFVPQKDIDFLYEESVRLFGNTLVQIAAPPAGPPLILPIGSVLNDGNIILNNGIDVKGIYWESPDRILYENGTIVYKSTGMEEKAKIAYGSVNKQGVINLIPEIGERKTSLRLLRSLNIKPLKPILSLKSTRIQVDNLDKIYRPKRSVNDINHFENVLYDFKYKLSLIEVMSEHYEFEKNLDNFVIESLCETIVDNFETVRNITLTKHPQHSCFVHQIREFCNKL